MKALFVRAPASRPQLLRWLLLALAVLALDQISKQLVAARLGIGQALPVTPFFSLLHIDNPGAAFSFLAAAGGWQRWLFTAFGIAASALIVVLLHRSRRALFSAALALILGGALGNVLDRVLAGRVTDFLDFYLVLGGHAWHWPAFNLADSAIFLGAVLLIIDESRKN